VWVNWSSTVMYMVSVGGHWVRSNSEFMNGEKDNPKMQKKGGWWVIRFPRCLTSPRRWEYYSHASRRIHDWHEMLEFHCIWVIPLGSVHSIRGDEDKRGRIEKEMEVLKRIV